MVLVLTLVHIPNSSVEIHSKLYKQVQIKRKTKLCTPRIKAYG